MSNQYQKGVSVLFAILILSVMLAMVLGLTTIVATQIRTVKGMGDSIVAFYAADAGIENMLKIIINEDPSAIPAALGPITLESNISYETNTVCCVTGPACVGSCPAQLLPDPSGTCAAPRYCVKSVGTYLSSAGETKRALEVEL